MNTNIDILYKIKKVEVSDALYDKVLNRLEKKRKTLPLYRVAVAASLLIGLFVGEAILISHNQHRQPSSSQLKSLVSINDNSLYHE